VITYPSSLACTDAISNCADYGMGVCTDVEFFEWVLQNCRLFCQLCGGYEQSNDL